MSLETGTYISDLVPTNPSGSDPKSQGDDHLRLIKSVLQTTFPEASGPILIDKDVSIRGDGTKVLIGTSTEDALEIDSALKTVRQLTPYTALFSPEMFIAENLGPLNRIPDIVHPVPFTEERIDDGGMYDPGTGRLQPDRAGWYRVTCGIELSIANPALSLSLVMRLNDANYDSMNSYASTADYAYSIWSGMVRFNGTSDYMTAHSLWTGGTGTSPILGNQFSATLVRPD
jgi:hypothetical protein